MRELAKAAVRGLATALVVPALVSHRIRCSVLGPDRALQGSTQAFARIPGLVGQYLRRAFLMRTLAGCDRTAAIEFGTTFSHPGARLGERVYIGPDCIIGFAHIERDVLLSPRVLILSGAHTHGSLDSGQPLRDQPLQRVPVHIGHGAWIGAGAIVMADVGADAIVGAGAVVTRAIPERTVAAGVPARVLRTRSEI